MELKETVYALNSTTIDLCLSVFAWAPFAPLDVWLSALAPLDTIENDTAAATRNIATAGTAFRMAP